MNQRNIRLFISSTFSDFVIERNYLQEEIFPKIEDFCARLGLEFQPIDLRWGVPEEAGANNKTMSVCLRELARCERPDSLKPQLLILLGDKYGWRPLPERIPVRLFHFFEERIFCREKFELAYVRDLNAVPSYYELRPRYEIFGHETEEEEWSAFENELRENLIRISKQYADEIAMDAELNCEMRSTGLGLSATHQEIRQGVLNCSDPEILKNIHVFCRQFLNENERHISIQADREHFGTMKQLSCDLLEKLPEGNYHKYDLHVDPGGYCRKSDLEHFGNCIYQELTRIISDQQRKTTVISEKELHRNWGRRLTDNFYERTAELHRIREFLLQKGKNKLVIFGEPGSGKSALLSVARQEQENSGREVIMRYCGISPASSKESLLLDSILEELAEKFPEAKSENASDAEEQSGWLSKKLQDFLRNIPPARSLILIIDAIDQLIDQRGCDEDQLWLKYDLPENVKLILSCAGDAGDARDFWRSDSHGTCLVMQHLSREAGEKILDSELKGKHRCLQPGQKKEILDVFSACGRPLWMKIAAEKASHSRSDQRVSFHGLGRLNDLVIDYFNQFFTVDRQGKILLTHLLFYIQDSPYGLPEKQLYELMCHDPEVMNEVWQSWTERKKEQSQRVTRIPYAIWVRLFDDLRPTLTEADLYGNQVLVFYHKQFYESVWDFISRNGFTVQKEMELWKLKAAHYSAQPNWFGDMPNIWKAAELPIVLKKLWKSDHSLVKLLSDFDFVVMMLNAGMGYELWQYYKVLDDLLMYDNSDLTVYRKINSFFFSNYYNLFSGEEQPGTILLKLALNEPPDSIIQRAAARFLTEHPFKGPYLKNLCPQNSRSPLSEYIYSFSNHQVNVFAVLQDRTVVYCSDIIYHLKTNGDLLHLSSGHDGVKIKGIRELNHSPVRERLISWDNCGRLRFWNLNFRYREFKLNSRHGSHVSFGDVQEFTDGKLIAWIESDEQSNNLLIIRPGDLSKYTLISIPGSIRGVSVIDRDTFAIWFDYLDSDVFIPYLRLYRINAQGEYQDIRTIKLGGKDTSCHLSGGNCSYGNFIFWHAHHCLVFPVSDLMNYTKNQVENEDNIQKVIYLRKGTDRYLVFALKNKQYETARLCFYNVAAKQQKYTSHPDKSYIVDMIELPGCRILSWARNGSIRIWSADGTLLSAFYEPTVPWHFSALPDGSLISNNGLGALKFWHHDRICSVRDQSAFQETSLLLHDGICAIWRTDGSFASVDPHTGHLFASGKLETNTKEVQLLHRDGERFFFLLEGPLADVYAAKSTSRNSLDFEPLNNSVWNSFPVSAGELPHDRYYIQANEELIVSSLDGAYRTAWACRYETDLTDHICQCGEKYLVAWGNCGCKIFDLQTHAERGMNFFRGSKYIELDKGMSVSPHEILLYSSEGWCLVIDLATLNSKTITDLPANANIIDLGDSYVLFDGLGAYSIFDLKNNRLVNAGEYLVHDDPVLYKQAYLRFLPSRCRFKWNSKVFYIEQELRMISVKCLDDPAFLAQWYVGGDIFIVDAVFLPDTGKIAVLFSDGSVTLLELQKDGITIFAPGIPCAMKMPPANMHRRHSLPKPSYMHPRPSSSLSQTEDDSVSITYRGEGPKVDRNAPCPCGSGKKYKFCCGRDKNHGYRG